MATIMEKAVFYHIPKTGGNWVRRALQNSTQVYADFKRHPTWRDFSTNGQYRFCFVRHPLTWFQSYWAYKMMRGWRSFESDPIDEFGTSDFNKFVSQVVDSFPGYVGFMYFRRIHPKTDFVGKQENLVEDLITALVNAKQPFHEGNVRETPPENVSMTKPEYDLNVAKAVVLSEKEVIQKYNYSEDVEEVLNKDKEALCQSINQ